MSSQIGWVKIHRKILDKGWYKNSKYVHLWLHILLKANHEGKELLWNGKIEIIKPGQFITGRKALSEETGLAQSTVEDILKVFEGESQIRQQKNNKFRLIEILNWDTYQTSDNKATSNRHLADTNNNDKNENKYIGNQKNSFVDKTVDNYKDGSTFKLSDGSTAIMRFGVWVDKDNPQIKVDRNYYKELP